MPGALFQRIRKKKKYEQRNKMIRKTKQTKDNNKTNKKQT